MAAAKELSMDAAVASDFQFFFIAKIKKNGSERLRWKSCFLFPPDWLW